jgi:3-oxoacyl-[acyl-carrier-protein] synthase-3
VLVIGTETLTRMVDWNDRTTCVLFGDGAGAVVLKADEDTGILSTHLHADGSKKELLWNPVGVSTGFKDGANGGGTINMKATTCSSTPSRRWTGRGRDPGCQRPGQVRPGLADPHQANLRIIEATAKRLDMSMDQVVVTVDKHGNTSSGSVPLALDAAAFGQGRAWPVAAAGSLRRRLHVGFGLLRY